MTFDKDAAKQILSCIDRNELARLGCDLASIPSPTGEEKAIAEYILAWFAEHGIKPVRQDVAPDRPNAVGILKGDGTGFSLGFNGHTDTSFIGTSADLRMVAGIEPEAELKGRIVEGKVQGLGISNMKGGLAAFMIAGKALKRSGVRLKGDVILACVVGEISRSPIGPWQSQDIAAKASGPAICSPTACTPTMPCAATARTSISSGHKPALFRSRSRPSGERRRPGARGARTSPWRRRMPL